MAKPQLVIRNYVTGPGDDTFTLSGTMMAAGLNTLAPDVTGLRVILADSTGAIVHDVTVPGGDYQTATKTGWKTDKQKRTWKYSNPALVGGLLNNARLAVNKHVPGSVSIKVHGQHGGFATEPVNIPLWVRVETTNGPICSDAAFPGPPT